MLTLEDVLNLQQRGTVRDIRKVLHNIITRMWQDPDFIVPDKTPLTEVSTSPWRIYCSFLKLFIMLQFRAMWSIMSNKQFSVITTSVDSAMAS